MILFCRLCKHGSHLSVLSAGYNVWDDEMFISVSHISVIPLYIVSHMQSEQVALMELGKCLLIISHRPLS